MASATRLFESSPPSGSREALTARDVYHVVTSDGIFDIGAVIDGLPVLGSVHPDNPRLRLDSFGAPRRLSRLDYVVDANYSTDGSFRIDPQPDVTDISFRDWSFSTRPTTVEVPRHVQVPVQHVDATTSQIVTRYVYEPKPYDFLVEEFVAQRTVNVSSFTGSDLYNIRLQTGRVHQFPDGQFYAFRGGNVTQMAAQTWTIRYEWYARSYVPPQGDPTSTPPGAISIDTDNDGIADTSLVGVGGPAAVAPALELGPYHAYIVVPAESPSDPPAFYVQPVFLVDPDGWQSLPGSPLT